MLRFIRGFLAVAVSLLIILVLLKIAVYVGAMNPVDIAKTIFAILAIIVFMIALQAAAQIIGLFMHVKQR